MTRLVVKVLPATDGWKVQGRWFKTKLEAITFAKLQAKAARPSQVRIWKKNGKIQTEYTYSGDPRRTIG